MKAAKVFEREIGFIQNETIKTAVIATLDAAPECITKIPASSTGKYHPEYSLGKGGLARHIKATVGIAYSLVESKILVGLTDNEFTEEEYADIVYATLILHDCCKAKDEHTSTIFEHPVLAADLFVETAEKVLNHEAYCEVEKMVKAIQNGIAHHMGIYTTSKYSDSVLSPPENPVEWIIHTCDLLSSRKFLEFNFEKYEEGFDK